MNEISFALQRKAREQMKCILMQDILQDLTICKLEGWSCLEYLNELKQIIDGFYQSKLQKYYGDRYGKSCSTLQRLRRGAAGRHQQPQTVLRCLPQTSQEGDEPPLSSEAQRRGKPKAARGTLLQRVRQGTPGGVCTEPEVLPSLRREDTSGSRAGTCPAGLGS